MNQQPKLGKGRASQPGRLGIRKLGNKPPHHFCVVARPIGGRKDKRPAAHKPQGELELAGSIRGIDVDEHEPGAGRSEHRDDPFRAIGGPDADTVATRKA